MATQPPALGKSDDSDPRPQDQGKARPVRIVDIDVPFTSLVVFMIRLAVAAIPAILLSALIIGGLYLLIVAIWLLGTNPFA